MGKHSIKREQIQKMRKYDVRKGRWLRTGVALTIFFIVVVLIFRLLVGISFVKGASMSPTLEDNQLVAYVRIVPAYKRGDVISVRMPSGQYYVKRVIAVAGDTVDIQDGQLYVNGELVEEDYIQGQTTIPDGGITCPYEVEEGKLFVMGDNREDSVDSRTFGAVLVKEAQGRLIWTSPF
jgi:signal peptidase I